MNVMVSMNLWGIIWDRGCKIPRQWSGTGCWGGKEVVAVWNSPLWDAMQTIRHIGGRNDNMNSLCAPCG